MTSETNGWDALQILGMALLLGQLACVSLAPEPLWGHLTEPPYCATASAVLVTVALALLRWLRPRPVRLEKLILALFLAGMPVIYLWAALLEPGAPSFRIEALGIVVFWLLSGLGYLRWPLLLGLGILAHGLGWDLWHHGGSTFIPDWYSLGCLIADAGIGLYALTQGKAYRAGD